MSTGVSWTAIITGTPDSTTDLTLRVASLTMSLRESTYCFVSLTVDPEQQSDVIARPNGSLDIYKTLLPDGSATLVVETNQQTPRLDSGGGSRSYTLTGTTSDSFTPFSTVDLYRRDIAMEKQLASGLYGWEISPLLAIYPGDTARVYEDDDVTYTDYEIDLVSITANQSGTIVSITEAAA